jgi:hypothetical protein
MKAARSIMKPLGASQRYSALFAENNLRGQFSCVCVAVADGLEERSSASLSCLEIRCRIYEMLYLRSGRSGYEEDPRRDREKAVTVLFGREQESPVFGRFAKSGPRFIQFGQETQSFLRTFIPIAKSAPQNWKCGEQFLLRLVEALLLQKAAAILAS